MNHNDLVVLYGNEEVGRLTLDKHGHMSFRYSRYDKTLSASMPPREQPYDEAGCLPFFLGVLPEGRAIERIAENIGVSVNDTFDILKSIGGDCAGAISVYTADQYNAGVHAPLTSRTSIPPSAEISNDQLSKIIRLLPSSPLGNNANAGIRISLAGV